MTDKFFKEEEQEEEIEKIKVGETEFAPEELEELVGKAQSIGDFEKKQGQTWEDVTKSWGKRGERIGEYKKQIEEYEEKIKSLENPPEQEEVDKEKIKAKVIAEANEFGLLTRDEAKKMFEDYYQQSRSGEKILAKVNKVLRKAKKDGNPTTEPEKLLEFMRDPANPADPAKAYKMMFEDELDEIKQRKLQSMKKEEFVTQKGSTAGAKKPIEKTPKSRDELKAALIEHLGASE